MVLGSMAKKVLGDACMFSLCVGFFQEIQKWSSVCVGLCNTTCIVIPECVSHRDPK